MIPPFYKELCVEINVLSQEVLLLKKSCGVYKPNFYETALDSYFNT